MAFSQGVKRAIKSQLTQRSISQRKLGRDLGWSQQYVWRRLADEDPLEFRPSELERIAGYFRVPVADLLPTDDQPAEVTV